MKKVPDQLEDELDHGDPETLGSANAEPTGVWRILRNSMFLTVVALLVVGLIVYWVS